MGMIMLSFSKDKEAMGFALATFGMGLGLAMFLGFEFKFFSERDQTGIALGKVVIEDWRVHYNQVRPHSNLNYQTLYEFKRTLGNCLTTGAIFSR